MSTGQESEVPAETRDEKESTAASNVDSAASSAFSTVAPHEPLQQGKKESKFEFRVLTPGTDDGANGTLKSESCDEVFVPLSNAKTASARTVHEGQLSRMVSPPLATVAKDFTLPPNLSEACCDEVCRNDGQGTSGDAAIFENNLPRPRIAGAVAQLASTSRSQVVLVRVAEQGCLLQLHSRNAAAYEKRLEKQRVRTAERMEQLRRDKRSDLHRRMLEVASRADDRLRSERLRKRRLQRDATRMRILEEQEKEESSNGTEECGDGCGGVEDTVKRSIPQKAPADITNRTVVAVNAKKKKPSNDAESSQWYAQLLDTCNSVH
eukprot:g4033.t1